ncbi:hypothetical protein [Paenibacillus lentus]|nr:hypothetical protein [Paenibacillus lentus]
MSNIDYTILENRIRLEKKHFPDGMTSDMIQLLDTVGTMIKDAYLAGLQEGQAEQEWNNQSCLGYAILAAEKMKWDETLTKELVRAMYRSFDFVTLNEAADAYRGSIY